MCADQVVKGFGTVDSGGFVDAWEVSWAFGIPLIEVSDCVLSLPASMLDLIRVDGAGEAIKVHASLLGDFS